MIDIMNDDEPNIKIPIREFYKLQCWKDINCIFVSEYTVSRSSMKSDGST